MDYVSAVDLSDPLSPLSVCVLQAGPGSSIDYTLVLFKTSLLNLVFRTPPPPTTVNLIVGSGNLTYMRTLAVYRKAESAI